MTDNVPPVTGALTSGSSTNDPDPMVTVSLSGTGALAGDTVQLYNGTGTGSPLGSSYTLTSTDISNGFANVQPGTLTNGTTYTLTARITDAAGNQSLVSTNSFTLTEDTTPPTANSVVETSPSGNLNVGATITLTVNMSEAVTVAGGVPTLTLNDGGTASYMGGSGTNALTVSYAVSAGQNTPDLTVTAVNLNSATITDRAGNAANLTGAITNLVTNYDVANTPPSSCSRPRPRR